MMRRLVFRERRKCIMSVLSKKDTFDPVGSPPEAGQTATLLHLRSDTNELFGHPLRSAFVGSPYASFLLDANGTVMLANRRAQRQFAPGTDAADIDIRGTTFADLTHQTPEEVFARLKAASSSARANFTMSTGRKRQTPRNLDFHVAMLHAPGQSTPIYHLTQDHLTSTVDALITMNGRRLETHEKLTRLEAQYSALHQVMIATEAYAHTASHDLRTPLNTLTGLLQIFEMNFGQDLPDRAVEYLSYMSRAVAQMDTLTGDFLEHARSAAIELVREDLDMTAMVKNALDDLKGEFEAIGATCEIIGPSVNLCAEPTLVRMLVNNLFTNAIKYRHDARPLHLRVTLVPKGDAPAQMIVQDNGMGFEPGASEAIFLPFRRCNTEIEGTGIGLATCREVCRRHEWSITAQSDGHTGAIFTVLMTT